MYRSRAERDVTVRAQTSVAAGGSRPLFATIRNQSGIVDNYDLTIDGLPADWWTISPPTVYLVPLGRGEGYEQEIEVVLHPPRSPASEARPWTIHLVATSRSSGQQVAAAGGTVTIEPYRELDLAVVPPLADGRLGARFEAVAANTANAPAEVAISLVDDEQNLTFEADGRVVTWKATRRALSPFTGLLRKRVDKLAAGVKTPKPGGASVKLPRAGQQLLTKTVTDQRKRAIAKADDTMAAAAGGHSIDPELGSTVVVIGPGETASIRFLVRPRAQLWIGRRTNRRFAVHARDVGDDAKPTVRQAALRQGPWLPPWITLVIALILIAVVLLLLLKPKDVKAPNVVGARSTFAAGKILQAAGLTLSPSVQTQVDAKVKPGSVVSQAPSAGNRVRKGSSVSILVATGLATATVPNVHDDTLAAADKKLAAAGFTLGSASPKPDPAEIVATQIPTAGELRAKGTPVDVFLKPRPRKHPKGTTGATGVTGAAGPAGAAGGAAAAGMVAVPAFAGTGLTAYQPKLVHDKLTSKETYRIDPSPAGTVLATVPKPGTKVKAPSVVEISVSAGYPLLTYDDRTNLTAVAGASGAGSGALSINRATEPGWDLDGRYLAFVRGASIVVRPIGQATAPDIPLAGAASGTSYGDPAFAPTRRAEIVASVLHTGNSDSLCFSQLISGRASAPSCLPVPGWTLGPITWGRSGYSLLVSATSAANPTTFGLLQFFSTTRFGSLASYWETAGTLVTPSSPGRGVLQAAISPDGKQLAAVSNLGNGTFHVILTTTQDLALKAAMTLPAFGCDVAWRSDGGELAVVDGGPECASQSGPIVGLAPANPKTLTTLVLKGENPAWQPIQLDQGP